MKTTKLVAIVTVSAAAVSAAPATTSANPVMACGANGPAEVTGQRVVVTFVVGEGPSGDIYRAPVSGPVGPGQPDNVQITDVSTSSSSADMGSGVESVALHTATDPCAPVGEWAYHMLVNGHSVCGDIVAHVTTVDPACAASEEETDAGGGGGCTIRARGVSGLRAWPVGALAAVGLVGRMVRRRRK